MKLFHYGTLAICDAINYYDAMFSDVYVVLCYVLSQYRCDEDRREVLRIN
jgi:hypothetical protein